METSVPDLSSKDALGKDMIYCIFFLETDKAGPLWYLAGHDDSVDQKYIHGTATQDRQIFCTLGEVSHFQINPKAPSLIMPWHSVL